YSLSLQQQHPTRPRFNLGSILIFQKARANLKLTRVGRHQWLGPGWIGSFPTLDNISLHGLAALDIIQHHSVHFKLNITRLSSLLNIIRFSIHRSRRMRGRTRSNFTHHTMGIRHVVQEGGF
ncbi:hypothetical protein LINPERHAP1_LOCUS14795, partial [Linum perenne]